MTTYELLGRKTEELTNLNEQYIELMRTVARIKAGELPLDALVITATPTTVSWRIEPVNGQGAMRIVIEEPTTRMTGS